MLMKFSKTISEAQDRLSPICGISWSPNQQRLAIATIDRTIQLYDENGEKRDKFSTKPVDAANGKESYVVRDIAFSPDSTRLAVAQSDNIVYVYKFGSNWNDKKVICNKFPQSSSVVKMIWLSVGPIIAGLEDGKVRALNTKTNKSQSLYEMRTSVVSLAANERGNGFLSGHDDGTIARYYMNEDAAHVSGRLIQHATSPLALAWASGFIVAAGCDRKISFYDSQGRQTRSFDYTQKDDEREFSVAASSPNGQTVAVGSYDKIRIFLWSPRQATWSESASKEINRFYTVTAMDWARDGSRLAIGSLCGAVVIFESMLKKAFIQDKFELSFVAPSQVLLKSLENRNDEMNTVMITSQRNREIYDVRIMGKNNYLVARTDESLILCDLTRNLTSEVSWTENGHNEKFYFENPNVCLIFNAGELSLIEYGDNFILRSVRTEFANPHVISVRLNERRSTTNNKKLAYLLDMKTICVIDLIKEVPLIQVNHNAKIDWLELNETGQKLLFRDKKTKLFLVDIASGNKKVLLLRAMFVQWVIQSDVVIAQSDENLAVWYNIDMPEHITLMKVRGDVQDVIRENGKSTIITRDGAAEFSFDLDEGLVEFGTAINDNDFTRALLFLETLENKPAAKAMWHNLANIALSQENLVVAHRCFAALGNASKTFYLDECVKILEKYKEQTGMENNCPEIRARLALMNGDIKSAETIYLENAVIENALEMYKSLRKWDEAIKLATRHGYSGIDELINDQMSYFMSSGQEETAGQMLESRGEIDQAMTLYLKAKEPIRAARLIQKSPNLLRDEELLNRVLSLLIEFDLYELAGDISQKVQQPSAAIDYYRRGQKFERAIELARRKSPTEVISLEEEYGDWLVSKGQIDASISRYIEAGATTKALEAAVNAKQWQKGLQIARVLDEPEPIRPYAMKMSEHLSQIGNVSAAEEVLIRAEMYKEAVDLLSRHSQWENAYLIAKKYLSKDIVHEMFTEIAAKLEKDGKLRDAEKVLLTIGEPDAAISMYKQLEHFDAMMNLIKQFHPDLVNSTHLRLAQQLETEKKYKAAENNFIAAGEWKAAIQMYGNANLWEEAFRVAKQNGTEETHRQVAYMWSRTLPIDGAFKLLSKMNLIDASISLACDATHYDFALELCRLAEKPTDEVHLKMAMDYEDEGKFNEAETEFIRANKPKEAILMYTHCRDWRAALRVAEQHMPSAINEVLLSQAAAAFEMRNYQEYEALMIRAGYTELVLQHYKEHEMWDDALRIAKEYVPSAVAEIQAQRMKMGNDISSHSSADATQLLQEASDHAQNERFRDAVNALLKINKSNADERMVERAMLRAAEICNQFLEGVDGKDVAKELAPRLVQFDHIGQAVQLYLAAEMTKEAVDVFVRTENWSKARRLAKEIDPQLLSYVEEQQKIRLRHEGNIDRLADIDIIGALDLLAEQGQWTRCIEKARQFSETAMHKYLAQYATELIHSRKCVDALQLYIQYGAPIINQNLNIYYRITLDCFSLPEKEGVRVWKDLRNFLFQLSQAMQSNGGEIENSVQDRFENLLLIAHYYVARAACREVSALNNIAVKISVAILRYTEIIPVDKAFYEAGMDLRMIGKESEAFILLNHYLDICEAIDEGSGNLVDHSDFALTDFPSSVPIPERMHLSDMIDAHEEVREWVLAVSMDQKINQVLPTDDRNLYESCLSPGDSPCVISGYPIVRKQPISFQRSNRLANRDAWSKFSVAAKMSPHTSVSEIIEFVEKWCGHANFMSV